MTPTTEAVRQAAAAAVSAQPDADTRSQTLAALAALGITSHTRTQYERVKAHVNRLRNHRPQRGGARENSGRQATMRTLAYTCTVTGDDAQVVEALTRYGHQDGDQRWMLTMTPPQRRYLLQRHGDKLTLERVV